MVIQPMSVSDQIIAVINDLCAKFGIAIDWTAENVMPYIEDLCARYIQFEIQTSIAWIICCASVTLVAGLIWAISGIVQAKSRCNDISEGIMYISMIVFWIGLCITVIVGMCQAYDIIEAMTIPEKTIIDYINSLITSASSR